MYTTTSITTVSVSTRKAQSTCSVPTVNQFATWTRVAPSPNPTWKKAIHDRRAEIPTSTVVTSSAGRAPSWRRNRPATRLPRSGRKTMS